VDFRHGRFFANARKADRNHGVNFCGPARFVWDRARKFYLMTEPTALCGTTLGNETERARYNAESVGEDRISQHLRRCRFRWASVPRVEATLGKETEGHVTTLKALARIA
jgi:hypothetical protein